LQSTEEQKLIYSGQLLNDAVVLKDVLRQYDGQETHTVHLVFTPKSFKHPYYNQPNTSKMQSTNTAAAAASSSSSSSMPETETPTAADAGAGVDSVDGLRYIVGYYFKCVYVYLISHCLFFTGIEM
jgi:hypothetical protein